MTTGYRIKEYREQLGMTQEELSLKSSVSRTIISELETGKRRITSTETLFKIAKALNKKITDIFLN